MRNVMSFDIEDYFHVAAFADCVSKSQWDQLPSRVEGNTKKILDMLETSRSHATFFILGWVAEKFPQLVRSIADAGHEIACHSLEHRRVSEMTPAEFREDTRCAKQTIEDTSGQPVRGYRAPSFSITSKSLWAIEILAELGFKFDSSIFPVDHPNYGMPNLPRFPFVLETKSGPLLEFPLTTIELGGHRSPMSGGAYLRILPYWYTRWGFRYLNEAERQPFCVYLHPWELDSDQPRISGTMTARLRHYTGLKGAQAKLGRLLLDFEFEHMGAIMDKLQHDISDPASRYFNWIPLARLNSAIT